MSRRRTDLVQLAVFVVAVTAILFGLLRASGREPLTPHGQQIQAIVPTAVSLSPGSEVRLAGVKIGRVAKVARRSGETVLLLELERSAPPVFRDATVDVRLRTVVGESFVAVRSGSPTTGELPDGGTLGPAQAVPDTQLDRVLSVLSAPVRASLKRDIQTLGLAFTDRGRSLYRTLDGASSSADAAKPLLDELDRKRNDVAAITRSLGRLGDALAARDAEIRTIAERLDPALTAFTANRAAMTRTLRALPPLLRAVDGTTGRLARFGTTATPTLRDIRIAVDTLQPAIARLEPTVAATGRALDALDAAAPKATKLFARLGPFTREAARTVPVLEGALAEANPLVRYLSPYTREVGGFFGSLGSMAAVADGLGHLGRMSAIVSISTLATLTPEMVKAYEGIQRLGGIDKALGAHGINYYPAPGESADPKPFTGTYPRLQPDPIPAK